MSRTSSAQPPPPPDDDIQNPKVAASTLDFLLIELVPTIQRITEQTLAREQKLVDEYKRSKVFNNGETTAGDGPHDGGEEEKEEGGEEKEPTRTSLGFPVVTDPTREAMHSRLDSMGYRVGQGLVERFSAGKPRPLTPLDTIKFICKDLWTLLYRKQIDNLKTNHRGIFVLSDSRFQPLSRVSVDRRAGPKASAEALERAGLHLAFPGGVVRGALMGLGIEASVVPEVTEVPMATFTIKTKGAKA